MSKSLNIAQATSALVAAALAAGHTITEDKARELVKTNKIASNKRIAEAVEQLAKPKRQGRIRTERVIEAGPRGFTFKSKVWQEAVASASGIALHPFFLPKLKAHAKSVNVSSAGTDAAAICAAINAAPVVEEQAAA